MSPILVNDLAIGPGIWLALTLLSCVTIFFKFQRLWSIRNLDLLLLFVLAPGMMALVGQSDNPPWIAFLWLFFGSFLWLLRCLLDLGLARRPLLEPNLNAAGLTCVSTGMLVLLVAETISLPLDVGAARNPADPGSNGPVADAPSAPSAVSQAEANATALPVADQPGVVRWRSSQIIVGRVLAGLSHLGLVAAILLIGWRHFERPMAGLAAAACYLLLPYTRVQVVDGGQVFPAALITTALVFYQRPALAGALIGLSAGWMPACHGLIPLWTGFYRRAGGLRFAVISVAVAGGCVLLGRNVGFIEDWTLALGARSLAGAGLLPGVEAPSTGSIWSGIDPSFRLPVLIAYFALVLVTTFWPSEKNLGELIALSAALLVASQFWFLDKGGTLVVLYLPLLLLMMFRPNLSSKKAFGRPVETNRTTESAASGR